MTLRYTTPIRARFLVVVTRTYPGDDTILEGSVTVNGQHEVPIADLRPIRAVFLDVQRTPVTEVKISSTAGTLNPGVAEVLFLK